MKTIVKAIKQAIIILLFILILIESFYIGYIYHKKSQQEITIYLQDSLYLAIDIKNNTTIIEPDLSKIIHYCYENEYIIIDVIDKTCK